MTIEGSLTLGMVKTPQKCCVICKFDNFDDICWVASQRLDLNLQIEIENEVVDVTGVK